MLVVGVGGLGCPVLELLCSAGIGTLGLADFDKVELHNLHRQFLFAEKDVQQLKTAVAVERLQARNSDTIFRTYPYSLSAQNVFAIIDGYDIVVDCTDNFAVRYLLSDACAIMGKPLVYGALYHYEGQVSVFNVKMVIRLLTATSSLPHRNLRKYRRAMRRASYPPFHR